MKRTSIIQTTRITIGLAVWLAAAAGLWWLLGQRPDPETSSAPAPALQQVAEFLVERPQQVELAFENPTRVGCGDPIFVVVDGVSRRAGEITRVQTAESTETQPVVTTVAYANLYSTAPALAGDAQLVYHETPNEIGWVLQMMFPEATRNKVGQLISQAYVDHHQEILLNLQPVIEDALREAVPVIESDLRTAFARRKDRWDAIGNRYRHEIVEGELVPLVERVIWPIVREESQPLVEELGQEIWEEASLFRFGWRVLYDATPLPKRDLTKKEFERFVGEQALPVIQGRTDEMITLQERILSRISNNREVRQVVGESLMTIIDDQDVQRLIVEIVQDVFIQNPRLTEVFRRHWNSDRARQAMELTGKRLEPTVAAIGEELFGNPHTQITPEFARVMRFKVLRKDARWFTLVPGTTPTADTSDDPDVLPVVRGEAGIDNPFAIERNLPPRSKLFSRDGQAIRGHDQP